MFVTDRFMSALAIDERFDLIGYDTGIIGYVADATNVVNDLRSHRGLRLRDLCHLMLRLLRTLIRDNQGKWLNQNKAKYGQ